MAKISKKTKDVILELGIELLRTLKELNDRDKLKLPRKLKTKKGDSNVNTPTNT